MRNDYIVHSAKGTHWRKKGAKYIERIWKNGKWRYIYNKVKSAAKKVSNTFQNAYNKLKNVKLKDIKIDKSVQDKIDSVLEEHGSDLLEMYSRTLKKIKQYKYFAKVKLSNGKYRYFYSYDEYQRYQKRSGILDKDYDYMQDVPVLDKKKTPEQIAKDADIGTDNGNCGSCAMAFEMQMRGYDVRSRADIDGVGRDDYEAMFNGLTKSTDNNWYFDRYKEENSAYNGKGFLGLKQPTEQEQLEVVKSDLERTIIERGGENQRGFMIINWTQTDPDENGVRHNSGGGHVFNYTVADGEVKFYDAQKGNSNNQTGGEVDIADYLDNTNYLANRQNSQGGTMTYCSFLRVDDKDLSEKAKDYVSYEPVETHDQPEEYEIYVMDVPLSNEEMEKKKHG